MKEQLQKISKFIASRMFYLILGICVAIAIPIAYAAWNSTVSSGQTLTTALWNDAVAKLVELNGRTTTLESAGNSWTSATTDCYIQNTGLACTWYNCADGYVVTGVYPCSGSWGTVRSIRCCKVK